MVLTIDCPGVAELSPDTTDHTNTHTQGFVCWQWFGCCFVVIVLTRPHHEKKYHLVVESLNMLSVPEKKLIIIIIVTIINECEEESKAPATLNGWSL